MKKKLLITVSLILAFILILNCVFVSSFIVFAEYDTSAAFDRSEGSISTPEGKLRILVLSDLQFANCIEMAFAFSAAKQTVSKAKPDLILTTGDNFGNNVKERHLNAFVRFMDSFDIPWGVTFGNHDYNASFLWRNTARLYRTPTTAFSTE